MIRNLVIGTQDRSLHKLCKELSSTENFFMFDDIQAVSSHIATLESGVAVFVDVEWPNNQSGYNVAREIRRRDDDSKVFLLTDKINDGQLHWSSKVRAEMVERVEPSFLSKLIPLASSLRLQIPNAWRTYFGGAAPTSAEQPSVNAERELERILGPMGPLLLQDALVNTNDNLHLALKSVVEFGTTASERQQIENLSNQFNN